MCLKIKDGHSFSPDPNARLVDPEASKRLRTIKGTRAVADEIGLSPQARDKAQRSLAHCQGAVAGDGEGFVAALINTLREHKSALPKDYDERTHVYSPGAPGTKLLFGDVKKELDAMTPEEREQWFDKRKVQRTMAEEAKIRRWNEEREARERDGKKKTKGVSHRTVGNILQAAGDVVREMAQG